MWYIQVTLCECCMCVCLSLSLSVSQACMYQRELGWHSSNFDQRIDRVQKRLKSTAFGRLPVVRFSEGIILKPTNQTQSPTTTLDPLSPVPPLLSQSQYVRTQASHIVACHVTPVIMKIVATRLLTWLVCFVFFGLVWFRFEF